MKADLETLWRKFFSGILCGKDGERLILAVSGGLDSMVLLHLAANQDELPDCNMKVIHIHHGLRETADRDAEFVRRAAERYGLKYLQRRIDPASSKGESVEEAARRLRYEVLERERKEFGAYGIVTAHHRDDVAETLLLQLCRGAGADGALGMRPVSGHILRPLLQAGRSELEHYARSEGIEFVEDETNASLDYTRNRIRHEILPRLNELVNSRSTEHLAEFCVDVAEREEWIASVLEHTAPKITSRDGEVMIPWSVAEEARYVRIRLLREALDRTVGRKDVSRIHFREMDRLFFAKRPKRIDLPRGGVAAACFEGIRIGRPSPQPSRFLSEIEAGPVSYGKLCFSLENSGVTGRKDFINRVLYDKIDRLTIIRKRVPGDWISLHGKRRKLKDYLTDRKVNPFLRDERAVLASGHRILWMEGLFLDEELKELPEDGRNERLLVIRNQGEMETKDEKRKYSGID